MGPKSKNKNIKNSKKHINQNKSYLADDENYQSFSNQLIKLGLELRDITGDGNCLFRALSDQMEGNETHHLEYRKLVCNYMKQNREEFEPFIAALIEDIDVASERKNIKNNKFEDYIKNLEKPGTYADNGCLVAFARLYKVDINIHQLNLPIWTITGNFKENNKVKQLHLSYHNNEHYSSIRKIGDNSKNPTDIYFQNGLIDNKSKGTKSNYTSKYDEENEISDNFESFHLKNHINNNNDYASNSLNYDDYFYDIDKSGIHDQHSNDLELELKVEQIMDITKCMDLSLIKQKLIESDNNVDMTITALYSLNDDHLDNETLQVTSNLKNTKNKKPSSISKSDKKKEKKQRQMERQKQKVAEENNSKQQAEKNSNKIDNISQNDIQNPMINESNSFSVTMNVVTRSI